MPDRHWTSRFRTSSGYSPYSGGTDDASAFTIPDRDGVLTTFLVQQGVLDAVLLEARPLPTYHLEVKSSGGEIGSAFNFSSAQFDRVRHSFAKWRIQYRFWCILTDKYRAGPAI